MWLGEPGSLIGRPIRLDLLIRTEEKITSPFGDLHGALDLYLRTRQVNAEVISFMVLRIAVNSDGLSGS